MTLLTLVLIVTTAQAEWTPPVDAAPMPTTPPSAPSSPPVPTMGATTPTDVATPARYETTPATAPTAVESAAKTPAASPSSGAPSFEKRLIALEIALSTIVVERPDLWQFDRLDSEAAQLLTIASNDAQRYAVRDVAARLDTFRRLGVKLRGGADDASGWRSPSQSSAGATPRRAPPTQLTSTSRPNDYDRRAPRAHDASGVLRPVVSQRPDAPKYAVIDDEGRIAALVTPTPEIDARLKGMVGQRVGLDGQRGYRTDLRREHVVAERVTPLETLRR
jgi:hypothetical protein